MAATDAARATCGARPSTPTACGSPPASFEKSAHVAFVMLARPGDVDGTCTGASCTNGTYYLKRAFVGDDGDPAPVLELEQKYIDFRTQRLVDPDHYLSRVEVGAPRLVADGTTSTTVVITMVNLEDQELGFGGQTVTLQQGTPGPPVAIPGPITDHGDGTHSFELTATDQPGSASWQIVVQSGNRTIWLQPELEITVDPLAELHAGHALVSASSTTEVPFVVNRGAADAGRGYLIVGSSSGTSPGIVFMGQRIPLNPDAILRFTAQNPSRDRFPGSGGQLDASGRAEAMLRLPARALLPYVGRRLDFVAVLAGTPEQTGLVGFDVLP